MGIEIAALAVAIIGTGVAIKGQHDASVAAGEAAAEGRKAQGEQKALNYQKQDNERRAQIREERVRRAKIMQASENGGVSGSSGEIGALGSMTTQLNSNLGINAGTAAANSNISGYLQNAADFNLAAQQASNTAQSGAAVGGMGMSLFNAAGGGSIFKNKGP